MALSENEITEDDLDDSTESLLAHGLLLRQEVMIMSEP
jgi:hypothetical protein